MSVGNSCLGCKFLYTHGEGYSNYTWENTVVNCAKDLNPHLPADEPYDWNRGNFPVQFDNWKKTNNSRCESYSPGDMITLDVEGEDGPADFTNDEEAIEVVCEHSNRKRHGYNTKD